MMVLMEVELGNEFNVLQLSAPPTQRFYCDHLMQLGWLPINFRVNFGFLPSPFSMAT